MESLRKLRKERSLSQQALGQLMGVSQQTINKYETGKTEPDFRMLKALAEFFHTSVDYLIGYTNNSACYRVVSDMDNSDFSITPYRVDKMRRSKSSSAHEGSYVAPNLFDTTPKERHHLTMYRKMTPQMQLSLDALLECIVPDDGYTDFKPLVK